MRLDSIALARLQTQNVSSGLFPRLIAEGKLTPDNHSEVEPPLPIPNRVVKRLSADDSADYLCESRTLSGTHEDKCPTLGGAFAFGLTDAALRSARRHKVHPRQDQSGVRFRFCDLGRIGRLARSPICGRAFIF